MILEEQSKLNRKPDDLQLLSVFNQFHDTSAMSTTKNQVSNRKNDNYYYRYRKIWIYYECNLSDDIKEIDQSINIV